MTPAEDVPDPFNTDEWDPARGAFWQHMMAGSFAGLAEHTVMFPVDTLKTHMQVLRSSPASTIQELVGAAGVPRLWRGVQSVFAGVIPAHAAYFSIYECCKPAFKDKVQRSSTAALIDSWTDTPAGSTSAAVGSGAAVCVATAAHDLVMTPTDVVKQRLQLGLNQNSISQAVGAILREQGPHAFVVALPVTLSMNLPYAALMGASNEVLRQRMTSTRDEAPSAVVHMIAGAGSGAFAAAITAPLDAVKTRLQTQHLSLSASGAVASAEGTLLYGSALEACKSLYREGGLAVFFRGAQARVLAHAPTVAICWTSYEGAKRFLETTFPSSRPRPDALTPTGHTSADAPTALAAAEATEAVPLVDHMIAGSIAGIVEHAAVFPIDTIKTHVQTATAEEAATLGTLGITRSLIRQHGVGHLLRGLSALIPAIGPAHALMFSGYEYVLKFGGAKERGASAERVAVVGACAGVVSTVLHDSCMVPAETIKQRLQLGYYRNAIHCFQAMLATGGGSFFRSLPTTLAMNVPCARASPRRALPRDTKEASRSPSACQRRGLAPPIQRLSCRVACRLLPDDDV